MKVFLAGLAGEGSRLMKVEPCPLDQKINILESFFYVKDWQIPFINDKWDFLLDSGAFTFFGGDKVVDWKDYTKKYCDFINKHKIEHFFELDIENLTSMDVTHDLRKQIQDSTGKNPIPVWRPSRGVEYWHRMVEEFDYVSISASGKFDSKWTRTPNGFQAMKQLVNIARQQGVKVHGLGYSKIKNLKEIRFHSVDSTSWMQGNRGGFIYQFDGHLIQQIQKPEGTRLNNVAGATNNFNEWLKFQRYAETNL